MTFLATRLLILIKKMFCYDEIYLWYGHLSRLGLLRRDFDTWMNTHTTGLAQTRLENNFVESFCFQPDQPEPMQSTAVSLFSTQSTCF